MVGQFFVADLLQVQKIQVRKFFFQFFDGRESLAGSRGQTWAVFEGGGHLVQKVQQSGVFFGAVEDQVFWKTIEMW